MPFINRCYSCRTIITVATGQCVFIIVSIASDGDERGECTFRFAATYAWQERRTTVCNTCGRLYQPAIDAKTCKAVTVVVIVVVFVEPGDFHIMPIVEYFGIGKACSRNN